MDAILSFSPALFIHAPEHARAERYRRRFPSLLLASAPTLKAALLFLCLPPRQARSRSTKSSFRSLFFYTSTPDTRYYYTIFSLLFLPRVFLFISRSRSSVTSLPSNDDGAVLRCPSRHATTSWSASRPSHGPRSTSKCHSSRCWHGPTGTPRCVRSRRASGQSGWPHDGRNASRCWDDWSWGSGTQCSCSLSPGPDPGASLPAASVRADL